MTIQGQPVLVVSLLPGSQHKKDISLSEVGLALDESLAQATKDTAPPEPVTFRHDSLKKVRREVYRKWLLTSAVLTIFILGVLSLYWGALLHAEENLGSFKIAVVDFDGLSAPYNQSGPLAIVGPAMHELARAELTLSPPTLGYVPLFASDFNYDPMEIRQRVYRNDYWAAIIVNANATASLYEAITIGDSTFDPSGTCQLIYNQARDQNAWSSYIYPELSRFLVLTVTSIGQQWTRDVLQNATTDAALRENIALVPQALSPAIGFSTFNLRPFYPTHATPSVTVGLVYLIIISFFSFSFYLPVYTKLLKPDDHPPLRFWQLVGVRYVGIQGAYLVLSLAFSLISVAFQINFRGTGPSMEDTTVVITGRGALNTPKFGAATFPVFWCLNYIAMMALGLICENVAMIIGQPWTGLWLIFWVVTNVSTSYYPIEIEPGFYGWGHAWPLHNVLEATRTLMFDLHDRLGLNFGVLLAWAALNTALYPLCCRFMHFKQKHGVKEYWA